MSERRWASPCPVYMVGCQQLACHRASPLLLELSHRLLSRGQVPKSGTHPESRIARRLGSCRCGRHGASLFDLVFRIMGDSRREVGWGIRNCRKFELTVLGNRLALGAGSCCVVRQSSPLLLLCWSGINGPKTHTPFPSVLTNVSTAGP